MFAISQVTVSCVFCPIMKGDSGDIRFRKTYTKVTRKDLRTSKVDFPFSSPLPDTAFVDSEKYDDILFFCRYFVVAIEHLELDKKL